METSKRLARVQVAMELVESLLNDGMAAVQPTHNLRNIHIERILLHTDFNENVIELIISSPDLELALRGQLLPFIDLGFEQVKG